MPLEEIASPMCICAINVVQKNQRELAKMRKCLRPEELVSHMGQMDTQTQHEELEKSYQVVVEDYRRIIERIASQAWWDSEMLLALEPTLSTCRWSVLSVQSPHHHRLQLRPRRNSPDVTKSLFLIKEYYRFIVAETLVEKVLSVPQLMLIQ